MVILMEGHEEQFERIFEHLPIEKFRENPSTIVSYMLDFGFDSREVQLLKNVISNDGKRFKDAISCPDNSVDAMYLRRCWHRR